MTARTQWQYRRRAYFWNEMSILQEMGEDGWELCGVWWIWLYFKRPLPTGQRKAA